MNVTGEVYNDLNGNGNLDPGEPGLQGWTVNLLNAAGNTVATTTSDANGNYEFDNLFPGTFTVEEILQAGWIQTQPVNPNYYQFTTQSGLNETGLNFGNFINTENLSGMVYNDLNGDGIERWRHRPRPGRLDDQRARLEQQHRRHDHQRRRRKLLVHRLCRSRPTPSKRSSRPAGSSPSRPTRRELIRSRQPAATYTGLDFGDFQLVSVSGNVYNDLNGNGQQDPGDPGLQGWTVDVVNAGGTVVASAVTRRQRQLHDPQCRPWLVHPSGGNQVRLGHHPACQPGLLLVHVVERRERRGRDIRQLPDDHASAATSTTTWMATACIPPASQAWQAGPSIWRIPAATSWQQCSPTRTATTRSPAWAGASYRSPRSCRRTGCRPSRSTRRYTPSRAQSGMNLLALNFGDHASPALNPVAVIDNGQPGYSETGTWSTAVGGFNGTNRVAKTSRSGGTRPRPRGTSPAWLRRRTYVYVTYAGKSGYSTAAPFTRL